MLHTGYLYKMGSGPINYNWNRRYILIDEVNKKLSYFQRETDKKARGHIDLSQVVISNVMSIKNRDNSFSIRISPSSKIEVCFSAESTQEAENWVKLISQVSKAGKSMLSETVVPEIEEIDGLKKKDTDQMFPNQTDLFRMLKNKLDKKGTKGRKTEVIKRDKVPSLEGKPLSFNQKVISEPEITTKAVFGDIPLVFRKQLESLEHYLTNDDLFKLHKYDNMSRITTFQKGPAFTIEKKSRIPWIGAFVVFLITFWLFGLFYASALMTMLAIPLTYYKPLVHISQNSIVYRSSNVVEYSDKTVFDYLKKHYREEVKLCGGKIVKDYNELSSDPDKHLIEYSFNFLPAADDITQIFNVPTKAKAQQYWCTDENETRFILTHIEEKVPGTKQLNHYEEAFVIVGSPEQLGKCLIYYYTDCGCPSSFIYDQINPENITLTYFHENDDEKAFDEEFGNTQTDFKALTRNLIRATGVKAKVDQKKYGILDDFSQSEEHIETEIVQDQRLAAGPSAGFDRLSLNRNRKTYKEHPNNLKISNDVPVGLSERFVGYFRLEDGLLWCHNQEELASQRGLITELLKKAGEKLMKGEGVVSISLPVRIFEKRSALERCGDLWTTGPKYLTLAANNYDPLERFKLVMCFMVGSMYMVCQQRKPFNPILGETFQGYWPDGTKIYIEHISHHPPISYFLVEHVDGLYTYEGSYTYTAKLVRLGNAVRGRQVGMNRIHFKDGSTIEYEFPFLKINGLMINKRTIQWEGSILFKDERNGIECELKFPEEGFFGLGGGKTYDMMTGTIIQNGQEVCEVEGSWLSHLSFNGMNLWKLENNDIILPLRVDDPLPSDCLFREDSVALGEGDMERAQIEKERLEVFQRNDKKLRTKK